MSRLTLALLLAVSLACSGCNTGSAQTATSAVGDSERGVQLIKVYGCGGCHQIPGVSGAGGLVGPSLAKVGRRTIIAGVLPNTPDNMVRWLRRPQSVVPGNAMPDMEMSDHDAKDIAAYLYELR